MRRAFIAIGVIASLGLTALPAHAAVQVKIEDFQLTPSTFTVAEGTAITWPSRRFRHHAPHIDASRGRRHVAVPIRVHRISNGARSGWSPARRVAIS